MMIGWTLCSIIFYTLMVYVWVKGLGIVKQHAPQKAVMFYFIMAAIRFTMALTLVGLYMLLSEHTQKEAASFCVTFCVMYVAMVIISIILKH